MQELHHPRVERGADRRWVVLCDDCDCDQTYPPLIGINTPMRSREEAELISENHREHRQVPFAMAHSEIPEGGEPIRGLPAMADEDLSEEAQHPPGKTLHLPATGPLPSDSGVPTFSAICSVIANSSRRRSA
jgi:hypothetical protein